MPTLPASPCQVPTCPHTRPCPIHGANPAGRQRASRRPANRGGLGYTYAWEQTSINWRRQYPLCAVHLVAAETVAAVVVDHVVAHEGNHARMFDPTNLASLCAGCHGRKLALERSGKPAQLEEFRELERAGMKRQGFPRSVMVG